MNDETATLLKKILNWMGENDYECGPVGSELFNDIQKLLAKHGFSEDN